MAKGKGLLQTYFVDPTRKRGSSLDSGETESKVGTMNDSFSDFGRPGVKSVNHRLIEWMVDLLMDDIKKIVSSSSVCFCPPASTSLLTTPCTTRSMCATKVASKTAPPPLFTSHPRTEPACKK